MPRRFVKSVKLTGRITENKSSTKDIDFVEKKLGQGMDQASIVREAISIYREYEEGKLFQDELKVKLKEVLSEFNLRLENDVEDQDNELSKDQVERMENALDSKFNSGNWGF